VLAGGSDQETQLENHTLERAGKSQDPRTCRSCCYMDCSKVGAIRLRNHKVV
jgi:hypothetical protein